MPRVSKNAKAAKRKEHNEKQAARYKQAAKKNKLTDKPLKAIQDLADSTYSDHPIYINIETPVEGESVVVLDTHQTLITGNTKILIDDPDAKEMLWAALIEKKRLIREREMIARVQERAAREPGKRGRPRRVLDNPVISGSEDNL